MANSFEAFDAAALRFAEQLAALDAALEATARRQTAFESVGGEATADVSRTPAAATPDGDAGDSLEREIRDALRELVDGGIKVTNLDELSTTARFS